MSTLRPRRSRFLQAYPLLRRGVRLTALAAGLGILSGCQAIVTSTPQSQVRIIDVSPDAPALDIYEGPNALAYNLGFGALTSYVLLAPGSYTIAAETAGSKQVLSSSKTAFAASTQYTVLIGNIAAGLRHLVLTDQSQPAPAGQVSLRFIDQATRMGAVDIYLVPAGQKLTALSALLTGLVFDTNTGYLNIPTGAYTLVIVPAGTVPGAAAATYSGTQVAYSEGSARTIILIDQQSPATPGLQVITADDFDPSAS